MMVSMLSYVYYDCFYFTIDVLKAEDRKLKKIVILYGIGQKLKVEELVECICIVVYCIVAVARSGCQVSILASDA